jgi:pimeloyl-ACP methyl ester carboxylesterase
MKHQNEQLNTSRRSALSKVSLGLAAATSMVGTFSSQPAVAQNSHTISSSTSASRTFVLVHGAWHGGWCWKYVAQALQAKGHRVYTPSLTGNAERSHLLSGSINLDTHITDLVNLFKWEELENVCLVAHSYGGWPVAGALEQIHSQVSSLVLLDAFKPENGQKGMDYASEFSRKSLAEAMARGEVARKGPGASAFSIKPSEYAWIDSKLTLQPNGVALQPIVLSGARERVAKKTYIRVPHYPQPAFDAALAQCKSSGDWKTFEILDSGHDAMIDQPGKVTELILASA